MTFLCKKWFPIIASKLSKLAIAFAYPNFRDCSRFFGFYPGNILSILRCFLCEKVNGGSNNNNSSNHSSNNKSLGKASQVLDFTYLLLTLSLCHRITMDFIRSLLLRLLTVQIFRATASFEMIDKKTPLVLQVTTVMFEGTKHGLWTAGFQTGVC